MFAIVRVLLTWCHHFKYPGFSKTSTDSPIENIGAGYALVSFYQKPVDALSL